MKTYPRVLTIICFLVTAHLSVSGAAKLVDIPVLPKGPGLIDGLLDEVCWNKALKTGNFKNLKPGKSVTEKTEAYIFADKNNLYIGFVGYFKDRRAKQKHINDDSRGSIWGDRMEIFIDPGNTGNYLQIALGINGKVFFLQPLLEELTYALQIFDDRYQIEMKIPFSALPVKEEDEFSDKWALNIVRGNKALKEYSTWAPLSGSAGFHDFENAYRTKSLKVDLKKMAQSQRLKAMGNLEFSLDRMLYDRQNNVKVKTELRFDKPLKKHRYHIVVYKHGKAVTEFTEKPVFLTNEFNIPIANFPKGRYHVKVSLLDPKGRILEIAQNRFWKIPPKKTRHKDMYTIKNHNIYKNGKFFFPINACYNLLTWKELRNRRFDKKRFEKAFHQQLQNLRRLGFNSAMADASNYPEIAKLAKTSKSLAKIFRPWVPSEMIRQMPLSFKDTLQICAEYGINIIPTSGEGIEFSPEFKDEEIDDWLKYFLRYREYDNILCWYLSGERDAAIRFNKTINQLYKEADPDHLTLNVVINAVGANKDAADILGTDPYPIPNNPVMMVGNHVERLNRVFKNRPNQSKWLVLQAFGGESCWARSPTAEELRAMVFIAMNYGIKGIAYFFKYRPKCERNGINTLTDKGYKELARTNKQIQKLASMYCLGKRLVKKFVDRTFDYVVIKHQGDVYASAVNTINKAKPFKLTLPKGVKKSGEAEVLYENRTLKFTNGVIADDFKPFEVHIYKISKRKIK